MSDLLIRTRLVGFDEAVARLNYFPDRMRRNFLRGGARQAGRVLARGLKGRLQAAGLATAAGSVRSSVRLIEQHTVRGTVQYGGRYQRSTGRGQQRRKETRDPWYAHILEWGARPHEIKADGRTPGRRKALRLPGGFARRVRHPGIRPGLYAETTAQQDMAAASRAFERYVEARVERFWRTGR